MLKRRQKYAFMLFLYRLIAPFNVLLWLFEILITLMQDEAEQSLRLQETFFREFTLVDGVNELADLKLDAQFFGLGCDLNDMSAPLPHLSHIRRMMKRQVLECGIQVPFPPFELLFDSLAPN